ncbi:MAG TPA: motility protein A [Candidatus Cloacimonadota bacterium]|nr:motility protein A [Candidatus Cloacimonadota bacterium]HOQ80263.1 motility protein A [Candidatus Cloacimonadota bacterium]HPK41266.1 motility protein A [Candidatus Cloacimonadota bacterium]
MDLGTIIGLVLAYALVFIPIIQAGDLMAFIDMPSVYIVVGGALAAVLMSFPIPELLGAFTALKKAFFTKPTDYAKLIDSLVDLGEKARREGLLALERELGNLDDEFLKKAIQLAVDGNEVQVIEGVMGIEIENIEDRHKTGKDIFDALGSVAPAFGMIGTLIGLIQMLKALDDPSNIGAGMAVALITTFYGSLIANTVCIPIATKLDRRSKHEVLEKNIILSGILSIQSGDNPRVLRDKLETYIPPKFRKGSK